MPHQDTDAKTPRAGHHVHFTLTIQSSRCDFAQEGRAEAVHPGRVEIAPEVRGPVERDPPQYSNRIHRDDAAALLSFLLQADASGTALQPCYLGVDDEPAPLHEVVDWLRERLGVTHWAEQSMTRRAGSKRCSNARARALGWKPRFASYRDGYASLGRNRH